MFCTNSVSKADDCFMFFSNQRLQPRVTFWFISCLESRIQSYVLQCDNNCNDAVSMALSLQDTEKGRYNKFLEQLVRASSLNLTCMEIPSCRFSMPNPSHVLPEKPK